MFYKIKGVLEEVLPPNRIVIKTAFLALEIFVPFNLTEILKRDFLGRELELYVVLLVRKNEFPQLYGFLTTEERELFQRLNALPKVGPVLALNLLSVFTPELLRKVIEEGRIKELAKVPGIGPKKAEKLFPELKSLFERLPFKGKTFPLEKERLLGEAKASLVSLGFDKREVEKVLIKVFQEEDTLESLLKKALRELAPPLKEEKAE